MRRRKTKKVVASEFVAAVRVKLRDLSFPEAWLERKIRENTAMLGLGPVKVVSFQKSYRAPVASISCYGMSRIAFCTLSNSCWGT